jgi:hypothetical protein
MYQHEPLEGDDTIHLLVIQPNTVVIPESTFNVLQCDIIHIQLDWIIDENDELAYTALSYVWGDTLEALLINDIFV